MTHTKAQKRAAALAKKQRRLCATGEKQSINITAIPKLSIPTLPLVRRSVIG